MDKEIKRYADAGDITSLKYIFVDSLDVDPTFEQYEESYNYCKSIPGLLERHEELTPFAHDPAQWTDAYWVKLKMDLKKNFSDQRMGHMREVAKVLMAEKVQRLHKERQAASKPAAAAPVRPAPQASAAPKTQPSVPSEAEQKRALQEEKLRIEAENKRIEEEQAAKKRAAAARAAALENENRRFESRQEAEGGTFPKKALGIAIAVAVVAVVLFLLLK